MENKRKRKVKALQGSPFYISLEPQDMIGQGSYAKIVRAWDVENPNCEYVAKIISNKKLLNQQIIKAEISILKKIPYHQNLVNCKKIRISSQYNYYFIMQYCNGGTLEKYISRCKQIITQQQIKNFLKQFCQGYKVLYNLGIVHRDLKPENILIHNFLYKIADFGLSKIIELTRNCKLFLQENDRNKCSIKGTPLYLAPQLYFSNQFTPELDMFSLGTILFRMVNKGQFPFYNKQKIFPNIQSYMNYMSKCNLPLIQNKMSKNLNDLINKMLQKQKQKRLSWKALFESEYLKSCENYIFYGKMMKSSLNLQFQNLYIANISKIQMKVIQSDENFEMLTEEINSISILSKLKFFKCIIVLIDHVVKKTNKLFQTLQKVNPQFVLVQQGNKLLLSSMQYALYLNQLIEKLFEQRDNFSQSQTSMMQSLFKEDRVYLKEVIMMFTEQYNQKNLIEEYDQDHLKERLYCFFLQYPRWKTLNKQYYDPGLKYLLIFTDLYMYILSEKNSFRGCRQSHQFVKYIQQIQKKRIDQVEKDIKIKFNNLGLSFLL